MAKADGSEKLEGLLEQILQDSAKVANLRAELGDKDAAGDAAPKE
jgi:type VI secretion system protein ImpB